MLKLQELFRSKFVRGVSVLAAGTAIAQGLGVLALPILTRIYSPEDFGLLAVFMALLALAAPVSALRYEVAIPLPESNRVALSLLVLSLVCIVLTTTVTTIIVWLFGQQLANLVGAPLLGKFLWLLPIGIAMTGAYSVFQYWATRKKAFARIARTRIERSVGGAVTQLLLGLAGLNAIGLIIGQIVSNAAGSFSLLRRVFLNDQTHIKALDIREIKKAALDYGRQPRYSVIESIANNAGVQIPIILIASMAKNSEVGYLMLAMQILQAPIGILGASISQVYLAHAVEEHRRGNLGEFTARTISGLSKIGIGPIVFLGILAPALFGFIFGNEWRRAGELVAWMTPWFLMQFMVSPISASLMVTGNQNIALTVQFFGFTLRIMMVIIFGYFENELLTEAYAISGFIFYLVYLCIVSRVCGVLFSHHIQIIKSVSPYVVAFVLAAIFFIKIFGLS